MRLVKVPAMNLEPGMFIAELDRPWLETPFALQGFVVGNNDEIIYVSKYVEHVYVDAEYKGRALPLSLAVAPTAPDPRKRLELDKRRADTSLLSNRRNPPQTPPATGGFA